MKAIQHYFEAILSPEGVVRYSPTSTRSSSDGEPGVFDGSVITCFLLCVRNFPIEQARFLDTCSNMAGINNNNFELFTFMNDFMLDETDDDFFVLYRNNSRLGWDCTM